MIYVIIVFQFLLSSLSFLNGLYLYYCAAPITKAKPARSQVNVMTRMDEVQGPLKMLAESMKSGERIKV